MVGTIVAGAAGVVAVPTVAGLAWRRARQRQVAKALQSDTANTTVEYRFVRSVGSASGSSYLLVIWASFGASTTNETI